MGTKLRNCQVCKELTYNESKICSKCFTSGKTSMYDKWERLKNRIKKYVYCIECFKQAEYYQNLRSCLCDHCVIIFDRLYKRLNIYWATKLKGWDGVSLKTCKKCQDRESFIDLLFRVICESCLDNYRKYCEDKLEKLEEKEADEE